MLKFLIPVTLTMLLGIAFKASTQPIDKNTTYTLGQLSQEPIQIISVPQPADAKEVGDTTMTIFQGASVPVSLFFVNGSQYDNIFNPNPTGLKINNQEFYFFCSEEQTIRQNFSNILEIYEFSFLGNKYLMMISFREDCLGAGCNYRCYNLFDITNPDGIYQASFASVFQGTASVGEFNNDGIIDFIRVAPKPPKNATEVSNNDHYLLTAYTFNRGNTLQLTNQKGHAYYLYVKADEEISQFSVLQADWFFPVKDTSGVAAPPTSYFAPYISFDPLYRYLYNPDGVRIEKNRWSVHLTDLGDLEAAQEFCRVLQNKQFNDVYIMIDQYGGDITFQVFAGNFMSRDIALDYLNKLKQIGFDGRIADFRNEY